MCATKKLFLVWVGVVAMSMISVAKADDTTSAWKPSGGFGFGMLHAGYGINLAVRNERNLVFTAIGCGQSSWLYRCGDQFSVGYFRSGLLSHRFSRHAFGFYAGQFERSDTGQKDATRGVGTGYVYFPNGMGNRGLSLGLGFEVGQTDGRTDHHQVQIQVGVQF